MELTKIKEERGYTVFCRIGTKYCDSWFSAPPKSITHVDLGYLRNRFPIINTELRLKRFKEQWEELFSEEVKR